MSGKPYDVSKEDEVADHNFINSELVMPVFCVFVFPFSDIWLAKRGLFKITHPIALQSLYFPFTPLGQVALYVVMRPLQASRGCSAMFVGVLIRWLFKFKHARGIPIGLPLQFKIGSL